MISKPALFGLLAAPCITAAGTGAYLASRQPATLPPLGTEPAALAGDRSPASVEASEAVVQDEVPAPVAAAPAAAVREAPSSTPRAAPAPSRPAREPARPSAARTAPSGPASAPPAARNNEGWSGLERTWPTRSADPAPGPDREAADTVSPAIEALPVEAPPPPPARRFEELVVSADSVIGLQVETAVTSERARVEDRVEARVVRDVKVGNDVAIPAGARAIGSITLVEPGGKIRERARLGIRFHTIVLGDGTQIPLRTETIYREGDSPAPESAAKIGGAAVGGAILGAILGGKRGAAIGGAAGAAGGTAATMAGDRNPATLPAGTNLTVRLSEPATVTVERDE
jgi:hypothetical protein